MHSRGLLPAFLLVLLVLTMGLVAGCGGGGEQSGNGSQDDAPGGTKKQGGEAAERESRQVKVALGTLSVVNVENRWIALQPTAETEGGDRTIFRVREDAEITLDDKEAELADVKKGQQAQIEYVVRTNPELRKERNMARVVTVFTRGEGSKEGEGAD